MEMDGPEQVLLIYRLTAGTSEGKHLHFPAPGSVDSKMPSWGCAIISIPRPHTRQRRMISRWQIILEANSLKKLWSRASRYSEIVACRE